MPDRVNCTICGAKLKPTYICLKCDIKQNLIGRSESSVKVEAEVIQKLNAHEALYGFCGWLTTRDEKTVMSAKDDASPMPELINMFAETNKLPEVRDNWSDNLTHPRS